MALLYSLHRLFRHNIPYFIKNLITFRKELWKYQEQDALCSLFFLKKSIERTCLIIEHYGTEWDETRLLKISNMKRTIELLNLVIEDDDYGFKCDLCGDEYFVALDKHISTLNNELWSLVRDGINGWWN